MRRAQWYIGGTLLHDRTKIEEKYSKVFVFAKKFKN